MKRLIFSFVILCASVSMFAQMPQVVSVASQSTNQVEFRFMEVYKQTLELNKNRFADVNKIQIGDTIYFPSRSGAGVEYWIADYPASGIHDCIWNLTGKYLTSEIITVPTDTTINKTQWNFVAPEPINTNSDLWAWLILIGLMLSVIAFYLLNRFRPWNNRRNLDSNPVIRGGLSNNPAEAAAQISALTGSPVVKSERGRLICASPVKVDMNFADGVKRVPLVSGEEYHRITEANRTIRYARHACGNLIGGSISQLPAGVTFVPSTEENATWEVEKKETKENNQNQENTNTQIEEMPTINLHFPVENEIAAVVEAVGLMMNVPTKVTYKELVIEFSPVEKKEKAEDK